MKERQQKQFDMEKLKEMFHDVPETKLEDVLKHHDLHGAIEVLVTDQQDQPNDDNDFPVINLTVSESQLAFHLNTY